MIVRVKAKQGLKVFLPLGVASAPGAQHVVLDGDTTLEVDDRHTFVRRRLFMGDLILVTERPAPFAEETEE